jgi:transposase
MVSIGRIAIDGTKIKANASYKKTKGASELDEWIEGIDQQIAEILQECEEVDRGEDEVMGEDKSVYEVEERLKEKRELKERLKRAKEKLEERKGKKINLTDEEAETMLHKGYRPEPSYNGQIAVEGSTGVIVGARLTTNPADYEGLKELIEEVEAGTGEKPKEVLADSGFSCFDNLGYLEEEEIVGYIPDQEMESIRKGTRAHPEFHKSRFRYNEADDSFRCPKGKSLSYKGMIRRKGRHEVRVYQGRECPGCARKSECTKSTYRTISKDVREILMERMRSRLGTKEGKRIYGKRKYMVEPVFGDMKYNRNFGELLLRGKVKASGEFMLMCIAHNLRKIAKHLTRRDGFLHLLASYVSKIRHLWSCVSTGTEVMAF